MNTKLITQLLILLCILTACQTATPLSSIITPINSEFTLAPHQSAAITDTDLIITFNSVLSDDRCPSGVECVASGPVTVALSAQQGSEEAASLTLQTFTEQNGRAPGGQFEGIENRAEVGDYIIQLVGVTPYPKDRTTAIKPSEYRVILTVTQK